MLIACTALLLDTSAEPLATTATVAAASEPLRVLFIGNSFTYGPAPYNRPDQLQLNNLPRLFKLVAESLGERVVVAEDTIGGCTLWMHRPSLNPEGCTNTLHCQPVANARVGANESCTVSAAIAAPAVGLPAIADQYAPCPQLLMRQPYGPWDVVVVQDQSSLPFVHAARHRMMLPAVRDVAAAYKRQGARVPRRHPPRVAAYMTWAYYNGSMAQCPGMMRAGCFPFGTLDDLSRCATSDLLYRKTSTVPCQAYALARAYAETLEHGADVLVPAGLALLAARGAPRIPGKCKGLIDEEYPYSDPLRKLRLPLSAADPADARWATPEAAKALFNDLGPGYNSTFCNDGCHLDHHPSVLAQYLNALVFFATLFKKSPLGAAAPDGTQRVDGMLLPALGAPEHAPVLQRIARDVVMPHLDTWWGKYARDGTDAVSPPVGPVPDS